MRCYHRTNQADAILEGGFRDSKGSYMTDEVHEGVFLSDRPLNENEGARGFVVLMIQIPVFQPLLGHGEIEEDLRSIVFRGDECLLEGQGQS